MAQEVDAIRLKPPEKTKVLGEYDLDSFVLEVDRAASVITDFRLEVGRGYESLWILPITPNGRLRLFHINYITIDDDPYVLQDPVAPDFVHAWQGSLATLKDGSVLVRVVANLTSAPAAYHVEATTRALDGGVRTFTLVWRG
jgi:hypothetical protein